MKGIGFIALLVTAIIIAILTVKSIKRGAAAREHASEIKMPENLTGLPGQVKQDLQKASREAEEKTRKALEEAQ